MLPMLPQAEAEQKPVVPAQNQPPSQGSDSDQKHSSTSRSVTESVVSEDFVTVEKEPKPLQRKYSLGKQSSFAKPTEEKPRKKKKAKKPPKKRESAFALDYAPWAKPPEAEENAAGNAPEPEPTAVPTELPDLNS